MRQQVRAVLPGCVEQRIVCLVMATSPEHVASTSVEGAHALLQRSAGQKPRHSVWYNPYDTVLLPTFETENCSQRQESTANPRKSVGVFVMSFL